MPKNALVLLKNCKNRQALSPPNPHWPPAAGSSATKPPDYPPMTKATRLALLVINADIFTYAFLTLF